MGVAFAKSSFGGWLGAGVGLGTSDDNVIVPSWPEQLRGVAEASTHVVTTTWSPDFVPGAPIALNVIEPSIPLSPLMFAIEKTTEPTANGLQTPDGAVQ